MSNPLTPAPHTRWSRTLGIAVGAAIAVGVVVMAFLWPTVTATAQNLPVAISGPSAQVSAVRSVLTKDAHGVFDLTVVSSRDAAIAGIKDRSYDGGIVLADTPEVLTASAASPVVTQLLGQVQQRLQERVTAQLAAAQADADRRAASAGHPSAAPRIPAVTVALTDVVPFASTDSRGTGMTASAFPLTLGGILGGIGISILVAGVWRRITAVALYAVAAGFAIVTVMQPWFGILQGGYLADVGAVALALFATGAFIVGATSLLGRPGIAIGAVITMLIGNPLSSATQPPQFLPGVWGAIGQWFVPGAASTLLRNLSYFPDASSLFSWLVLAGWAALGVLLTLFGHFRSREVVHLDTWDEDAAPAITRTSVPA